MKKVTLLLFATALIPSFILHYTSQIEIYSEDFHQRNYSHYTNSACLCNSCDYLYCQMVKTNKCDKNKIIYFYAQNSYSTRHFSMCIEKSHAIYYWNINLYIYSFTACFCKYLDNIK